MRVVDYIDDSEIKISIFDWNEKYTVQCEDGDVTISYKYKKADFSLNDIKQAYTSEKLSWIKNQIKRLRIEKPFLEVDVDPKDEFEEII